MPGAGLLCQRRQAVGLSQERPAELSASHFTYVSEIETNKRTPSVGVLRRIATALGVPMSRLVAEAETLEAERMGGRPRRTNEQ